MDLFHCAHNLYTFDLARFTENIVNLYTFDLARFTENIVNNPGYVDVYPSSRIPKNLHYLVKPTHRSTFLMSKNISGSGDNLKEKGFRITTDQQTLASVLQLSSDDEVVTIYLLR